MVRPVLRLAVISALTFTALACSPPTVRLKRVLDPRLAAALEKPMAVEVDDNRGGLVARTAEKAAGGAGKSLSRHGLKGDVLGMISDGLEGAGDLAQDAAGRYDRAEALVLRAIALGRKPLYQQLLERVRRAKEEAARLEREATPAS